MSFSKHGLAPHAVDLGKSVLTLSALGVLAKLLKVDLSQLQILGATFAPAAGNLVPGVIGVALVYAFAAFVVARGEATVEEEISPEAVEARVAAAKSKPALLLAILIAPFSLVVYLLPIIAGIFTIALLWSDMWVVLKLATATLSK